jgi:hypothetical protein
VRGISADCSDVPDTFLSSYGIAVAPGGSTASEVVSNTIEAGGSIETIWPCTSAAISTGAIGGVFQDNVLRGGPCSTSYDFDEQSVSADPSVVWDNNFVPTKTALYRDEGANLLTTPDEINALPGGYSGNYSTP